MRLYEVIAREYGITFDYIEANWDDRQFFGFLTVMEERAEAERNARRQAELKGRAKDRR